MPHPVRLVPVALVAAALAGCNQTAGSGPVAGAGTVPVASAALPAGVSPPGFHLPEGGGCAGDIARFKAVLANDVQIGHLTQAVYGRASADVRQAEDACAAGREHQARMIVFSAKRTYGYPT